MIYATLLSRGQFNSFFQSHPIHDGSIPRAVSELDLQHAVSYRGQRECSAGTVFAKVWFSQGMPSKLTPRVIVSEKIAENTIFKHKH